ncbi:MAG: methyltransferase domain-containing protein [Caldilineaceae bacterium]|nr:methyltransferase domain-containing protein [Caldilineaceae bacterium]
MTPTKDTNEIPPMYFRRQDEHADEEFYQTPRRVVHIDDGAIRAWTALLAKLLPSGGTYLDLMSSWRSHLPDEVKPARVVGLGMNADEMADNPQLDSYVVHNVNVTPTLPLATAEFNAVICTVSVQYMTQPIALFREVNRLLQPGGIFALAFSNRCFATKAIAAWLTSTDAQHVELVEYYFAASGNWTRPQTARHTPRHADPLYAVWAYQLPDTTSVA